MRIQFYELSVTGTLHPVPSKDSCSPCTLHCKGQDYAHHKEFVEMLPANRRIVLIDLISRPVPSHWTIFQIGTLVVAEVDTDWMIFT